eukprot:CAMPEP_0198566482 /NCGR_PEP_ID=MMETSP1462-20131121/103370_1 /TAXON_ID=1333877 /ORGANISM="Brandtodinium nutriculum, Strain RCC3387" /LENGTH=80 /DNA_ID=CAMNT_0044297507 /DNA_START=423 /DNA_END=665 /DNA_ORIENTATION=+
MVRENERTLGLGLQHMRRNLLKACRAHGSELLKPSRANLNASGTNIATNMSYMGFPVRNEFMTVYLAPSKSKRKPLSSAL